MKTYLEQEMGKNDVVFWDEILDAQVASYGKVDLKTAFKAIEWGKPQKIFDIGCGNGSFLMALAKIHPEIEFVGIDHNQAFLDLGQSRSEDLSLKNIRFENVFFAEAGLEENCDLIICRYTLTHVNSPLNFLKGAYKTLSNGGRLVVIEPVYSLTHAQASGSFLEFIKLFSSCLEQLGANSDIGLNLPKYFKSVGFDFEELLFGHCSYLNCGVEEFIDVLKKTVVLMHKMVPELTSKQDVERCLPIFDQKEFESLKYPPAILNTQFIVQKFVS